MNLTQDRFRGALLGLATGDALGTTVEFKSRGSFAPLTDIVGGGPFGLEAGQWTDDTSMALCLAESLLACDGTDLADQNERYLSWWRNGTNSVTGTCFDIGNTVRSALVRYRETGEPAAGSSDPYSAGNGSIMRLAPVPMFFAGDPERAIREAAASSTTTHGAPEAVDACRLMAAILVGLLGGISKGEVLSVSWLETMAGLEIESLSPKIEAIARGGYKGADEAEVRGSGYVVESLEAALWAFWRSEDFREGALLAVNLGDDADTTGAIYGQLAGACHGMQGIPSDWLDKLAWRERIQDLADQLYSMHA